VTVLAWAVTGPVFQYSDTWQLVINTGTTIVTFLMVFLIQNTQNRDTIALQLKLDEPILATRGARDDLACIEDGSEKDIEAGRRQLHARAGHAHGNRTAEHGCRREPDDGDRPSNAAGTIRGSPSTSSVRHEPPTHHGGKVAVDRFIRAGQPRHCGRDHAGL